MEVYVGTAGWNYPDWVGPFYPEKPERGFSQLSFYSAFFDCVEVNATFYRHFPPRNGEKWLMEVFENPRFVFLIKLFKEFTHGSRRKDAAFVQNKKIVTEFLKPFVEQKKLGGLLVQFIEFYKPTDESKSYISTILDEFHDYPLFFELRNKAWYTDSARDFLKKNEINIIAVDQPQLSGMMEFDTDILGKIGYVRLHGRNAEKWEDSRKGLRQGKPNDESERNARYDYLYNSDELDEIEKKLLKKKEWCERVYVVPNNHPLGKAVANGLELIKRLRNLQKVRIPDTVIKYFPELEKIAERVSLTPKVEPTKKGDPSPQGDLFVQ